MLILNTQNTLVLITSIKGGNIHQFPFFPSAKSLIIQSDKQYPSGSVYVDPDKILHHIE